MKQGLTTTGLQLWTQGTTGVEGPTVKASEFGSALAMGRLDNGVTDDLAIGAPRDRVGSIRAGSVTVLLGGAKGLTTAGVGGTRFHEATSGIVGTSEDWDQFGCSLAISAVQSRQRGNLMIGVQGEAVGNVERAGAFTQLAATSAGPSGVKSRTFTASSRGVRGTASAYDFLGSSLG